MPLRPLQKLLVALLASLATPLAAQDRIPSHCLAFAEGPESLVRAGFRDPVPQDAVRLSYIDHAMFLLQTPGGLSAVTDYSGYIGPADFVPTIVTMNIAHGTHHTRFPDPAIDHVLEGWDRDGAAADHHLDLGEMLVRNVPTDIRAEGGRVRPDGNSIFVFEAAGLCIGHMGHLHHEPTPEDYALLGRLDVVMIAVDGGLTLDLPTVVDVMQRLRASIVIPMHWFGPATLDRFVAAMAGDFAVERPGTSEILLSREALPARPTVMVLTPRPLDD